MIGLAFAAFVFNTSEFLPVGLLPDMAASLNESVSFMGLVITGYAWVVSIMSLPLALLTARFERKKLLLFLLGLFAICHFAVLWVDSFWSLYATRIGVALAHSIFWSIMNPLAARMAPAGKRATGLAAVMGGTIVATVLGVPLGTKMGHLFGWAESFFVIGAAAFLVLMLLWYVLPQCPSRSAGSLKSLPVILKRPALLQLYGVTMITMLGQFTAYSFISPILEHSAGMSGSDVVDVLLLFGLAGIIGTVLSSKTVDRYPSASLTVPLVVLSMSLVALARAAAFALGRCSDGNLHGAQCQRACGGLRCCGRRNIALFGHLQYRHWRRSVCRIPRLAAFRLYACGFRGRHFHHDQRALLPWRLFPYGLRTAASRRSLA